MTLDKVSKNAFVEPIQALQNYYTKNLKDLSQNQNNTCIFAVRGFIDSLKPDLQSGFLCAEILGWSWKRDSNTRPAHYECAALPTELFQQILILYEYIDFDLKIQLKYGKIYLGIFIIIGLKSTILL